MTSMSRLIFFWNWTLCENTQKQTKTVVPFSCCFPDMSHEIVYVVSDNDSRFELLQTRSKLTHRDAQRMQRFEILVVDHIGLQFVQTLRLLCNQLCSKYSTRYAAFVCGNRRSFPVTILAIFLVVIVAPITTTVTTIVICTVWRIIVVFRCCRCCSRRMVYQIIRRRCLWNRLCRRRRCRRWLVSKRVHGRWYVVVVVVNRLFRIVITIRCAARYCRRFGTGELGDGVVLRFFRWRGSLGITSIFLSVSNGGHFFIFRFLFIYSFVNNHDILSMVLK